MKLGEKIYHCKRLIDDEGMVSYADPQEIVLQLRHCTVQPESGFTSLLQYGEKINDYQKMILQPYERWFGKVEEGDLFYLDGAKPLPLETENGAFANYEVDSVSNQNMVNVVKLKRRP